MKRTKVRSLVKIPASVVILCAGISLLLSGCERGACPFVAGSGPSCSATVPEPGIYRITYKDSTGADQTKEIIVSGMPGDNVLCVADCTTIIGDPELIAPVPPNNLPPDCSQARALNPLLSNDPARMVEEAIEGVTDPDGDPIGIRIDSIEQDEPTDGLFAGDRCPDAERTSSHTARVRAERTERGDGRVYRLAFTASDRRGGFCEGSVGVCVPLVEGGTCLDGNRALDNSESCSTAGGLRTPDLSVAISDSPDPVFQGALLIYNLTLSNNATDFASQVVLTLNLQSGITFIEADRLADCTEASGAVICKVSFLPALTSNTVSITVMPTAAGTITSTASVRALETDPNLDNNTATATTVVGTSTEADLAVRITDNPGSVTRGGAVTYVVTVTNNGPAAATNVVLLDALPPIEVSDPDILVSQGSFSRQLRNRTITCNFGTLASRASATLTVTGFTATAGTITNTASATADEPDPNTANNSASEDTSVNAAAAMNLLPRWLDQSQLGSTCRPLADRSARFEVPLDIHGRPWLLSWLSCSQRN